MRTFGLSLLTVTLICTLAGCLPAPYYQKEEAIPQNAWNYNFKPTFTFDITDTTAFYQSYFLIRHTQAYPYCNVWVFLNVTTPGDTVVKKERINVVLAEATGKWLGRGMGEIFEQRMKFVFSDAVSFRRAGTYKITMEQNMRINPLPDVLNVGIRLEKNPARR
jgi:gliding motility-associated lipoprotein GldH